MATTCIVFYFTFTSDVYDSSPTSKISWPSENSPSSKTCWLWQRTPLKISWLRKFKTWPSINFQIINGLERSEGVRLCLISGKNSKPVLQDHCSHLYFYHVFNFRSLWTTSPHEAPRWWCCQEIARANSDFIAFHSQRPRYPSFVNEKFKAKSCSDFLWIWKNFEFIFKTFDFIKIINQFWTPKLEKF